MRHLRCGLDRVGGIVGTEVMTTANVVPGLNYWGLFDGVPSNSDSNPRRGQSTVPSGSGASRSHPDAAGTTPSSCPLSRA
jgi:hypothetical protein